MSENSNSDHRERPGRVCHVAADEPVGRDGDYWFKDRRLMVWRGTRWLPFEDDAKC